MSFVFCVCVCDQRERSLLLTVSVARPCVCVRDSLGRRLSVCLWVRARGFLLCPFAAIDPWTHVCAATAPRALPRSDEGRWDQRAREGGRKKKEGRARWQCAHPSRRVDCGLTAPNLQTRLKHSKRKKKKRQTDGWTGHAEGEAPHRRDSLMGAKKKTEKSRYTANKREKDMQRKTHTDPVGDRIWSVPVDLLPSFFSPHSQGQARQVKDVRRAAQGRHEMGERAGTMSNGKEREKNLV
nr:hypothetical protein [Pandoravirus aubagnensis]